MQYESKFNVGEVCFYANVSCMDIFSFDSYEKEDKNELKKYISHIFDVITEHKITSVSFTTNEDGDVITSYHTDVLNGNNIYADGRKHLEICEDFTFKTKEEAVDYILKVASKRVNEFVNVFNEVKKEMTETKK